MREIVAVICIYNIKAFLSSWTWDRKYRHIKTIEDATVNQFKELTFVTAVQCKNVCPLWIVPLLEFETFSYNSQSVLMNNTRLPENIKHTKAFQKERSLPTNMIRKTSILYIGLVLLRLYGYSYPLKVHYAHVFLSYIVYHIYSNACAI